MLSDDDDDSIDLRWLQVQFTSNTAAPAQALVLLADWLRFTVVLSGADNDSADLRELPVQFSSYTAAAAQTLILST